MTDERDDELDHLASEVARWRRYTLQPCHSDGDPIVSRRPVKVWGTAKQHALESHASLLHELERETKGSASPIREWRP